MREIWGSDCCRWPRREPVRWSSRSVGSGRSVGGHRRCRPARRRTHRRLAARSARHAAIGNYVYADGATNTRVSVAVDELQRRSRGAGFLATPTDVFAVPGDAVEHSTRAYEGRSGMSKTLGRPLRALSGGRLLRRCYAPGSDPGINDSTAPQQGRLRASPSGCSGGGPRSRGTTGRGLHDVAPPTRTRLVVKNRALAAAYAGATASASRSSAGFNALMAALLVHDLHTGGRAAHLQDEA